MRYSEPIPVNLKVGGLARTQLVRVNYRSESRLKKYGCVEKKDDRTYYAGKRRSLNAVAATAHSKREGFMVVVVIARTFEYRRRYGNSKLKRLRYDTTLFEFLGFIYLCSSHVARGNSAKAVHTRGREAGVLRRRRRGRCRYSNT